MSTFHKIYLFYIYNVIICIFKLYHDENMIIIIHNIKNHVLNINKQNRKSLKFMGLCLCVSVSQFSISMMYIRLCRHFSCAPERKHEKYRNTERTNGQSVVFTDQASKPNYQKTKGAKLVHWTCKKPLEGHARDRRAKHARWNYCPRPTKLHRSDESTKRGIEREESGWEGESEGVRKGESERERERNSLPGGQRAHVLIKFSGNLGDSK